jgi:hypothetical protein
MAQYHLLLLNSFHLRFYSVNVQIQSPTEWHWTSSLCTVTGVQILCKFLSALFYTVTLWASAQAEQPTAAAVRTCQPSMHTILFTYVPSTYLTTDLKKLPFYKEWHSQLVCIENQCIIFFTVPTKACQLQLLLFSLTTDRTLINIKIISYIVMSNFYLIYFLWVIKIPYWM